MRDQNVTYAKCVGILLMVLCHAGTNVWQLIPFISMFHMPLFFFLSGYCLKESHFDNPSRFVRKRLKGLYWPYLKWSLVFLALHNVFVSLNLYGNVGTQWAEASVQPYGLREYIVRLSGVVFAMKGHEQLLGGYWFLRELFVGSVISFALLWLLHIAKHYVYMRNGVLLLFGGVFCLRLSYCLMPFALKLR